MVSICVIANSNIITLLKYILGHNIVTIVYTLFGCFNVHITRLKDKIKLQTSINIFIYLLGGLDSLYDLKGGVKDKVFSSEVYYTVMKF